MNSKIYKLLMWYFTLKLGDRAKCTVETTAPRPCFVVINNHYLIAMHINA